MSESSDSSQNNGPNVTKALFRLKLELWLIVAAAAVSLFLGATSYKSSITNGVETTSVTLHNPASRTLMTAALLAAVFACLRLKTHAQASKRACMLALWSFSFSCLLAGGAWNSLLEEPLKMLFLILIWIVVTWFFQRFWMRQWRSAGL